MNKKLFLALIFTMFLSLTVFAQMQIRNSDNNVVMHVSQTGEVGIGTSTPTARLHLNRGTQNNVLRLEGIQEKTEQTRIMTIDNIGNVGYRDMTSISVGYRLQTDELRSENRQTVYKIDIKTHDYLEVYLITSGQNDGDDGDWDEDDNGGVTQSHLQIQIWNGSSWVNTSYLIERSVTCPDNDTWVTDKYYRQWTLSDANIADNSLIRFKLWTTNPAGQVNYHNYAELVIRFWSHDGGHLSQTIINTL